MLDHPFVPSPNLLVHSSIILNVPISKLLDAVATNAVLVNRTMLGRYVASANVAMYYCPLTSNTYYINTHLKKIYVLLTNNYDTIYQVSDSIYISIAYIMGKYKQEVWDDAIKELFSRATQYKDNLERVLYAHRSMQSAIKSLEDVGIFNASKFDPYYIPRCVKSLKRKYGVVGTIENNLIKLDFKNLKVGNDLEGYIKYKHLILYVTKTNHKLIRTVYIFPSGFMYDTDWNVLHDLYFHPHLSMRNICFGNQSQFISQYISTKNIDMYLDTLIEVVKSYNPGSREEDGDDGEQGPYRSVTRITQDILRVEKLFDKLSDVTNIDLRCKTAIIKMNEQQDLPSGGLYFDGGSCPHCGQETVYSEAIDCYVCGNDECVANMHIIECPSCGAAMSAMWAHDRYYHYCISDDCLSGPIRPYIRNGVPYPICPICGDIASYYPEDDIYVCGNHGNIEFNSNFQLNVELATEGGSTFHRESGTILLD